MPTGKLVYVMDDDPDIGEICTIAFEARGHQVRTFLTVADGLAAIRAQAPDLLVLDVMIDEADSGFKVAQALAKSNPRLPIVMLSSIAEASSQVFDVSQLPVAKLLEKPPEPRALVDLAERLMAGGR